MHENCTTCNRYNPSSTKNINLDFYQDIRLQKWGVNGNADFTVIGLMFRG
jgi:hypothetical protein